MTWPPRGSGGALLPTLGSEARSELGFRRGRARERQGLDASKIPGKPRTSIGNQQLRRRAVDDRATADRGSDHSNLPHEVSDRDEQRGQSRCSPRTPRQFDFGAAALGPRPAPAYRFRARDQDCRPALLRLVDRLRLRAPLIDFMLDLPHASTGYTDTAPSCHSASLTAPATCRISKRPVQDLRAGSLHGATAECRDHCTAARSSTLSLPSRTTAYTRVSAARPGPLRRRARA